MIALRWSSFGILLLAGLLAATGCDESSAPPDENPGVSFSYSGTLQGHFQAVGTAAAALDPRRSFAVAFRSEAGELQLCAYQTAAPGQGNFLLLNVGARDSPGEYSVPPGWAPYAIKYQPGTFLVGVDSTRTRVKDISTFRYGSVKVDELSTNVRGRFTVTTHLSRLTDGQFDVPMATLAELPVICH